MVVTRNYLYLLFYTWAQISYGLSQVEIESVESHVSREGLNQEIPDKYEDKIRSIPLEIFKLADNKDYLNRIRIARASTTNTTEMEETLIAQLTPTTLPPSIIPQFLQFQREIEKPIYLLREQLDISSLIDAVDKDTGRPKFKLPLIDLSHHSANFTIDLFYDGTTQESGILGLGWSLPQTFITMDHQSSIFLEDEKYYIFLQDFPQQLILDTMKSSDAVFSFKLPSGQSDVEIHYFKNEERWEVNSSGVKQIYGHTKTNDLNAINWELTWENWRGIGSTVTGQKRLATAWYLVEVRDTNNNVMQFAYNTVNIAVPGGKSYTREIYLETISDSYGNKITFNYADKHESEYNLFPAFDSNGNIDTQMVQTRFLEGYKITTLNYEQVIHFIYTIKERKRFLLGINQDGDITNQPIIQFIYENLSNWHVLKKVILSAGENVEFQYESIGQVSPVTEKIGQRFDVPKDHKISYGSDDILLSYIDRQGQVALRMFNQDMTEELYSSVSSSALSRFPLLGRNSVKWYESMRAEGFLAFIFYYSTDKELCLLREEDGKWLPTVKYYAFNEEAIIRFGKNYIVVIDTNSFVEIINWNSDSKQWKKEKFSSEFNKMPSLLTAFDRMFVVYDDYVLWVGYMNQNNEWKSKIIKKISGAASDITKTLHKFDLDKESEKNLLYFFKNNALQLSNNLLLLNRWKAEGTLLYSVINLFTLNRRYEIVQEQEYSVLQDDLIKFSHEFEGKKNNFITLGYDDNFKIVVKKLRGPLLDDINDKIRNKKEREKVKNEIYKNILDSLGKPFLLKPAKYYAVLKSQTATCGNNTFTFLGDSWKENVTSDMKSEQSSISVPLGDKFVLNRDDSYNSFKLYSQSNQREKHGNSLLDLNVKHLNETLIRYPVYLAHQASDMAVGVVEFSSNEGISKTYKLPREEKLSPWSSHQTLVTSIDTENPDLKTLVFRQQWGIRYLLPNPVITKVTLNLDDGNKRITGYKYSSPKVLGTTVYYEKTSTIPGNDKEAFGWIESSKDFVNQNNIQIFNAQGKLIKTLQLREEKREDDKSMQYEKNLNSSTCILDKTGKLEVAQFLPHEIEDEEFGYYGFEDYEINIRNKWSFNEGNVEKYKFSFTGQNYLRLSDQILEGTFKPKNQNEKYVASCWLRPSSKVLDLGVVTPYFKATINTEIGEEIFELLGEVKIQSGDWFYLEVIIDLFYAKQIYRGLNDQKGSTTDIEETNTNLTITIFIGSGMNVTFDIDHIRFSPLNYDFQANVYDIRTQQVREVIYGDGFVERYIYDKYKEKIATLNRYGQLDVFNTYTKASSVSRIHQLQSKIQIHPKSGFYEQFAASSFHKRWQVDDAYAFQISPGHILHSSNDRDMLRLNLYDISSVSYGLRLCFSLKSRTASINLNRNLLLINNNERADIMFAGKRLSIPREGELLMIVEYSRVFIWVDGGLYFDTTTNMPPLNIEMSGTARISDLMIFSEPSVQVTYFNILGEKLQEIELESANKVIVTEYLYDELGRQSIITQPVNMERPSNETLLTYYTNFIVNDNPYKADSVWKTGRLKGDMSAILGGYGYSQIKYDNNPLDEKCEVGLPGREFSISAPYAKRFATSTDNLFVNSLFPTSQNYSYQVEYKPGMVEDISVFDEKKNRIAWYVHVPGNKDLLSTYEYNAEGKLIKSIPPLYYEKVQISLQQVEKNLLNSSLSEDEKTLQDRLATQVSYNENGKVIMKSTPDSGRMENLYDDNGLLKFAVHYSNLDKEEIETVIYFDYDRFGRLSSTGEVTSHYPKEKLLTLELSESNTKEYQRFYYSDTESEPILRRKLKRTITFNDGEPFIEESIINFDRETLSKRIIIPSESNDDALSTVEINKRYVAGKVREIEYPVNVQGEPFKLTYQYNKLGKIIGIGTPGNDKQFANFVYNAAGQVINEQHQPESQKSFDRQYDYNAPGFLTTVKDKFLTERVFYTERSYGGHGYGDGTVTRTKFKATWHQYCDNNKLGLNENSFVNNMITPEKSKICFQELKRAGYLNESNHQTKSYYPALDSTLPIICSFGITANQIQDKLGKEGFPIEYGHSYDYGNHGELTKAKYFVGDEVNSPLQPDTFAENIPGINATASQEIWQLLKKSRYLIVDNTKVDTSLSHGKRGKSFINQGLYRDLRSINSSYGKYALPLERLLTAYFSRKKKLSKSGFDDAFLKWSGGVRTDRTEEASKQIFQMLVNKQYDSRPLSEDFKKSLKKYESFIHDIVRILSEHFARELGESEFDVESYSIDANGNYKHFHTGFDRYELNYRNYTNQVDNVKFRSSASSKREQNFALKHDGRGNVNQALHKGIKKIIYNSVSNRPTGIELTDGRTLSFYYDARGERILKRITDSLGQIVKEIHYIRDDLGRVLVERHIIYKSRDAAPIVNITAYIYGPKGLLGFIRQDEFYSVITDHEGSIRLVVKDNEVLAAYDYLPYGNLMREYASDPDAHISYRYTGQEWDEETGLYNYHARLYDPSIGRFYQIDPKEQYFSPYKYAGNSPISMTDPDGEFAFLIPLIIVLGVGGAYLGGAAANRNWNPAKWDFTKGSTWLGIIGGGVGGALLPVGFGASVSTFTALGLSSTTAIATTTSLGLGMAYLNIATANDNWDPTKWDFSSPGTWNGAFQGFVLGTGLAGGIKSAASFYKSIPSALGKGAFISGSIGTAGGFFTLNGFASNWDFSKPGVYLGFVDAVTGAPDIPMFMRGFGKYLNKSWRNIVNNRKLATKVIGEVLGGAAITGSSAFLMGLAASEAEWDMTSPSTYYGITTGILTGGQISSFSKKSFIKLRTQKGIKMRKNIEQLSIKVANDVLAHYDNIIKSGFAADDSYSRMVKTRLDKGAIPNTALSTVITDKIILAAFSGNNGPGLIMIYTYNKQSSPIVKFSQILENNKYIGSKLVTLNEHPQRNIEIKNAIDNVQQNIRQENVNKFVKATREGKLNKLLNEAFEVEKTKIDILNDIEASLRVNGHVDEKFIDNVIKLHITAQDSVTTKISGQIKIEENKMIELRSKGKLTKEEGYHLVEMKNQKKLLEKQLTERKQAVTLEFHERQKELTGELSNSMKGFKEAVTLWDPTNCAEPHALTALSRKNEIFPPYSRSNMNDNAQDIRFLATYKLDKLPELTPFPRCDNCVITTAHIKNVITDPQWIYVLRDLQDKVYNMKQKLHLLKERVFFLVPYYDMTNKLIRSNSTNE